jgi:adenylylsulfate kinase
MIYWFTGQPGAGKTVLAELLKVKLEAPRNFAYKTYRIDGDEMRDLFSNKDYSIKGRIANIDAAQKIAHYLHNQELDVIVSLVSPYLDQREEFKKILGDQLIEFYIHTNTKRGREQYHVEGYQPPLNNFIDVDTTIDTPEESLNKIIQQIK